MKLLKSYLLIIAALLCSLPISAFNIEVGGIYYDNTSNTELTVAVTYLGSSSSYYPNEYSGNVNIPEKITYDGKEYTVTSIGRGAFSGCSDLKRVTIPNSVTSIGGSAFEDCSGLTSITIPNSVTSIGERAFEGCYNLTNVNMGNSVTSIGVRAFYRCYSLTSITIPNSVTSIGGSAFEDCSGLTSITIPNSVTSIGSDAFYGTGWYNNRSDGVLYLDNWLVDYKGTMPYNTTVNIYNGTKAIASGAFFQCSGLTSVTIPNSVTSIGSSAFYGCSALKSITIPNTVTSIGSSAFYGCSALKSITIPNTVTSIESGAFYGCSGMTSVTIPNSVTSIGNSAFEGCSSLTSVTVGNSVRSIKNMAFLNCSNLTAVHITDLSAWCKIKFDNVTSNPTAWASHLYLNGEEITKLVIPADISSIGDYAFWGCSGLTNVTIPNSVTSIGNSAFSSCSGLTSVTIPNSVTSIGGSAFEDCSGLTSATIPNSVTSIGNSAFEGCSSLTSITIPNSVTSIGGSAFYNCYGLTSITIPNSVTSIGGSAFEDCYGLTSITIPNSVTSIGSSAFEDCSGLASIKVESGNTKYDSRDNCNAIIETNTNTLIIGCTNTLIPNSVTSIGNHAFYGTGWYKKQSDGVLYLDNKLIGYKGNMPSNTSIVVKNGTTEISGGAFSGCSGLTSVTIPNSVTSIGKNAFYNCSGLTSVTIPNSVTNIERFAFYGCSSLTSVTIPDSVTSIGDYAFSGCSGLTSVSIGKSVTSIEYYAFSGCSNMSEVHINDLSAWCKIKFEDNPTKYAHHIYYNGEELKKLIIPDDVTSIGESAFSGCSGLTSVTIGNSVTSIGDYAFSSCSGLTSVTIPNSVTSIGDYAFSGCSGLTSVTIPNSVTSIGANPFYNTGWYKSRSHGVIYLDNWVIDYKPYEPYDIYVDTKIEINEGTKGIAAHAFSHSSGIISVTIPNTMKYIGHHAFLNCDGLANIVIPDSVTNIDTSAFADCTGLTKIKIGNSVKCIGDEIFDGCDYLESIYLSDISIWCSSYMGSLGTKSIDGKKIYLNGEEVRKLIIPETVSKIEKNAFEYCCDLTSVTIPSSVISIGDRAFYNCIGLDSVYVMKKNPIQITYDTFAYRSSIDIDNLVSNNAILFVPYGYREKYMLEEGWSSFYNIEEIPDASWVVPDTIMSIGINFSFPIYMNNEMELSAFQCDIYIPEGITLQKNSKGKYDITLDSERSDDHTLSAALQPDGSVRVVVVSMTSAPLFGTEGPLFHLNLLAGEELGTYTIDVKNISVSDATGNLYNLPNVSGTVEIYYKPGDANGDGSVLVNDVVYTVNRILGIEADDFIFRAADMNGDGNILVNDVVMIVNTILGTNTTTAALAPRHKNAFETLSVTDSKTAYGMTEFGITLSNAGRYTAMQFDMELADGTDITDIKVSMPTDHSVAYRRIDNTTVRVVVTSLTNEALAEGAQLCISMKDAAGKTVAFTNGRAACNNGQMVGIMPGSTVLGGTTGIDGINVGFAPADVYSIDGKVVKKNATTLDGLKPGVYVVNGRKVVVEK